MDELSVLNYTPTSRTGICKVAIDTCGYSRFGRPVLAGWAAVNIPVPSRGIDYLSSHRQLSDTGPSDQVS